MPHVDIGVHPHERGEGAGARAEADPARPPRQQLTLVEDGGRKHPQVVLCEFQRSPPAPDLLCRLADALRRRRLVGVRPVEDRAERPLRIRGREQRRHRRTLGDAHDDGSLRPGSVHHGANVVHPLLERRHAVDLVGQAGASLIEDDRSGKAREPPPPRRHARLLPLVLDVRSRARHDDEVERALAEHLVGDGDLVRVRVSRLRDIH